MSTLCPLLGPDICLILFCDEVGLLPTKKKKKKAEKNPLLQIGTLLYLDLELHIQGSLCEVWSTNMSLVLTLLEMQKKF